MQAKGQLMGFLARAGMKAELRRLEPFFQRDEHFLETDVCDLANVKFLDGAPGYQGQVALTLTSHAIYVRPTRMKADVVRIPYERVVDVLTKPGLFEVITTTASWLFAEKGAPMGGDKYQQVTDAVSRIHNVRRTIDVPGGRLMALHRPFEENSDAEWTFQTTRGVDVTDPSVQAVVRRELADEIARYGDPWSAGVDE